MGRKRVLSDIEERTQAAIKALNDIRRCLESGGHIDGFVTKWREKNPDGADDSKAREYYARNLLLATALIKGNLPCFFSRGEVYRTLLGWLIDYHEKNMILQDNNEAFSIALNKALDIFNCEIYGKGEGK